MASASPRSKVRISKIAGRYLVFDLDDVMYIRRHHSMCAVLIGTMPQNPTQNIFLSLPIELYAEEAELLQAKGVAYVADEAADHLSWLRNMDDQMRRSYVRLIKAQRRKAQLAMDGQKAEKQARYQAQRREKSKSTLAGTKSVTEAAEAAEATAETGANDALSFPPIGDSSKRVEEGLDNPSRPPTIQKQSTGPGENRRPAVTPTTSAALLSLAPSPDAGGGDRGREASGNDNGSHDSSSEHALVVSSSSSRALYEHLNERGYFITPGLRFGGDYSVYPGDPFRFHAHFLATAYGWDEELSLLDLVSSGRLGTSVKKSFLMAAQTPPAANPSVVAAKEQEGDGERAGKLRAFCIEWARM